MRGLDEGVSRNVAFSPAGDPLVRVVDHQHCGVEWIGKQGRETAHQFLAMTPQRGVVVQRVGDGGEIWEQAAQHVVRGRRGLG